MLFRSCSSLATRPASICFAPGFDSDFSAALMSLMLFSSSFARFSRIFARS